MNKLFNITNWKFYFFLALLVRGIILGYFISEYKVQHPEKVQNSFVVIHNDYGYHLSPVDNYMNTGNFFYIEGQKFAGRIPGYSLSYFFLRFLFSQSTAVSLLIIFQFIFSCFSVYLLALISYRIFNSSGIFYLTYILFLLSTFTAIFDFQTIAESFCVSAFIVFLYYLVSYFEGANNKRRSLLIAGLFLTWAIFLRPYLGLFIALVPLMIFYKETKFKIEKFKSAIVGVLLFLLSFLFAESIWITRNYLVMQKFIPMEDSLDNAYGKTYSKGWQGIRKLIFAWGGEGAYFEQGSEAWWFRRATNEEAKGFKFKDHIFKNISSYNLDSLEHLRDLYKEYLLTSDENRATALDSEIEKQSALYRNDFVKNNPYSFYMYKPLEGIKRLIFKSGSSYLTLPPFGQMTFFQKAIKLFYSVFYYFILVFGSMGFIISMFISKLAKFYSGISVIFILTLCGTIIFYSPIQEVRYFIIAYPLLVLFSSYTLEFLYLCLKHGNKQILIQ